MNQESEKKLPKLRQDLKILQTSAGEDGSKRWLLFDPIQNKYFTIALDTFELISKWNENKTGSEFLADLQKEGYEFDQASLDTFIHFIVASGLTVTDNHEGVLRLVNTSELAKKNIFKWLIHNYLFIRIPVFKPDKWLSDNLRFVHFFYSNLWRNIVLFLGGIGIILVLRNWDTYVSTFQHFFSKEGLFFYFITLLFIKSFHELGHAFTAKKYGCKVPSIGVAFLVLFPVLYTDTSDSWKLKSKNKRLKIVFAGIKVELYLAMLATFLWSFTPDGIINSILFMIATTSWITSILLNISPFLKFDGYYALSDWSESENLQPRSFAMAKWYIRGLVLGLQEEAPEYLSSKKRNFFIIYAILTSIYRFFLFLGIAVLVYYFAFKVLGIILFLVEIIWFILLPIYKELKIWWNKKEKITLNKNNKISLVVILMMTFIFFVPWNAKINLPAILQVENYTNIYANKESQIVSINFKSGDRVNKGDVLLLLESPNLSLSIEKCKQEIETIKLELKKQAGSKDILAKIFLLEENLIRKEKELEGFLGVNAKLTVVAPFDGYIYFNDTYGVNQWVNPKEPILSIYDPNKLKIRAFCPEERVRDVDINSASYFISNLSEVDTIDVDINSISEVSTPYLRYPELSSEYGGDIATRHDFNKRMYSEKAYYQINAAVLNSNRIFKIRTKGTLVVSGVRRSIAKIFLLKFVSVLIRESGF
ncbi:HlyD family efflux transporter periplasmic adaptor subunit [Colwellia sp. MB02u-10]|uniref:HlyD family efflux transporter periplasmic adaptor subunit n=1 Tax=Colwellia sp. MB02u-10 TaxID=2759828 RepID=UPI0015F3FD97|nr:HlyD family efflux transporter periplasmic adaptor subunit [Colwellia sp. MB02u-10]MBA6340001.1 HlyD family efflux transporter periplasmic adaptor subunit [Colwellia sp. MB02u-10]